MAAFVYRDGDVVPPDVTRVDVHPSVRALPPKAFYGCRQLEEVRLREGLEEIGGMAFFGCSSLRRLRCPSTVVRIMAWAFAGCSKLSTVELSGIVAVEGAVFFRCRSLDGIEIPPRAFLFQPGFYRNDNCRLVADGTIARTYIIGDAVLIAPGCLTILPASRLTELRDAIRTVASGGEGTEEDRLRRIRREVRGEVRGEVSAILDLAFWKARIDEAERAGVDAANDRRESAGGGRKRAKVGIALTREAREGCRGAGKGKVIAENILPFLDGLWKNGLQGGP